MSKEILRKINNTDLIEMKENTVSVSCSTEEKHEEQMQPRKKILCSGINRYHITDICGEGTFGKVFKAINMKTSKAVVVKLLKKEDGAQREMRMLDAVSVLKLTKANVVRCEEKFQLRGRTCLVFEQLDMNLHDLLEQRHGCPLTISEIRPIAYQLLIAFYALKRIRVVHSDLKPDNVMLVNHKSEPFRVKLIDFGVSFMTSESSYMYGKKIQPMGYRSPEVTLGLPVSEAIDMWGLGCILLYLYLGKHPFPYKCEYQGMKRIVDMLGQPTYHFLKAGLYTHKFFMEDTHWCHPGWWLKTPSEYKPGTGIGATELSHIRSLDDLITLYPLLNGHCELQDRRAFVSLLKGLLMIDANWRLTPELGLSHPFITMAHQMDYMESPYFMNCLNKMGVLHLDEKDDEGFTSNGVAEEEARVEEASAVPLSDDKGSASPQSSDRVEDLDHPGDNTASDSASPQSSDRVEDLDHPGDNTASDSAAPQSSDRVEDLDHPGDVTAASDIDASGSAAEESAENYQAPDLQQQLLNETHPAKVSCLKRMKKFFSRILKRMKRAFRCK